MQKTLATLCGVMFLGLAAAGARADDLTFLSTQMRPLEEATKARTLILKGAPMPVTYVPEEPPQLPIHLQADEQGAHTIGLVGALHGELAPLAAMLQPIDQESALVTQRGIPDDIAKLARLGTEHLMYVPWMQATYIMAANKKALQYLPKGANAGDADLRAAWRVGGECREGDRAAGAGISGRADGADGAVPRGVSAAVVHRRRGDAVSVARMPWRCGRLTRRCGNT